MQIKVLRQSRLARNTGWMLLGQALRLVIQTMYFTVIARSLGAKNYGAFVGVVGLVAILFPFSTLGSGFLLVKNVARDGQQFKKYWGRALLTTFLSSSVLFALVVLFSCFVLPPAIPTRLVMLVAASDLFGMSFAELGGRAFLAFEHLKWTASINVLLSTSRLTAAIILVALHHSPSALQWGNFYFGSTGLVAVGALSLVLIKLGTPTFSFLRNAAELREGLYFSVSQSAQSIYNDIDKTMLARLGTLEAAGIYGAAYRLIDVSFAPVWSLLNAAYPNFFRAGVGGISATIHYARPLILRALGYASLVATLMLAGAGIVPYVLGSEYRLTVEALRWLAVLPMLKVVHCFLSDALAGAGHMALRSVIHIGVAVFNVLINLWIIPAYSWRGAAWSSIASDALLACGMCAAVVVLDGRSKDAQGGRQALEARAEA
ncbi:MAG TPA: oligosaccharide flippase family protein [Candidatus Cybelea sp.]|nr:oligosaccharide flippase family protein [Candidatus Cybelea sp.]